MDNHFFAVNFEGEEQDDNPDKALIRFEFIELLIRVAKEKYMKSGECKSLTSALERLFDVNIMKLCEEALENWQGFRDDHLYTVEINDVF
jgi:hypothetical protein